MGENPVVPRLLIVIVRGRTVSWPLRPTATNSVGMLA
jgi:hypothetical protein